MPLRVPFAPRSEHVRLGAGRQGLPTRSLFCKRFHIWGAASRAVVRIMRLVLWPRAYLPCTLDSSSRACEVNRIGWTHGPDQTPVVLGPGHCIKKRQASRFYGSKPSHSPRYAARSLAREHARPIETGWTRGSCSARALTLRSEEHQPSRITGPKPGHVRCIRKEAKCCTAWLPQGTRAGCGHFRSCVCSLPTPTLLGFGQSFHLLTSLI